MILSASVNARWRALKATRASCVDTRGNSYIVTYVSDSMDEGGGLSTYRCDSGKYDRVQHRGIRQVIVRRCSLPLFLADPWRIAGCHILVVIILILVGGLALHTMASSGGLGRWHVSYRSLLVVLLRR